jgi:hypothetical protein
VQSLGRILGTGRRRDQGREIGLLVLRQQMQMLQRQVKGHSTPPPRPAPVGGCEQGVAQIPMVVVLGETLDPSGSRASAQGDDWSTMKPNGPTMRSDHARNAAV